MINNYKKSNLTVKQCPPRHVNLSITNYINFMVGGVESVAPVA